MDAGKVAIITGAGSGMGRSTAQRFANHGAKVVVVDIDEEAARGTVERIRSSDGTATAITADVSVASEVESLVEETVETYGSIDVLYNNAGIPQQRTPVDSVTEATWDRIQSVNLKSAFLGAKYAVPYMKDQENGVILNTASASGLRPREGLSAYSASKGGMIALTKQLAVELAEFGIRVVAICPVAADTDMLPGFIPDDVSMEDTLESVGESIPLGRLAQPEDVAGTAAFLASDDASMITGTTIEVDGGRGV